MSQRLILSQETKSCTMKQSVSVTKTEPICTDTNCAQTNERKRQITMEDQVEKGFKLKEFLINEVLITVIAIINIIRLGFLFQTNFAEQSQPILMQCLLL